MEVSPCGVFKKRTVDRLLFLSFLIVCRSIKCLALRAPSFVGPLEFPDTVKILCSLLLIGAMVSLHAAETLARFLLPMDLTWADVTYVFEQRILWSGGR